MTVEMVLEKVKELCEAHGASEVILYGSRAKGTALERSDIDVAVAGAREFDVLEEEIEEIPTLYTVDLLLIQYYAITDFVAGSPREVLRKAYKAEMITGDIWMEMLKVRNQLAHDYDGVIVKEYCRKIVGEYIDRLYAFKENVQTLLRD